jgi:hypothetical protein
MDDYIDNKSYDTINLVHNAKFEVFISRNLYWAPVNTLGSTKYTNYDIRQFLNYSPQEKKKLISNVYEAIQLFQISRFEEKIDVLHLDYHGKKWEHHKPGYHAVLSNNGCCSSMASWLYYLVGDKYPQCGYFGYYRPDGSGHVYNYFYHEGHYFLLDINAMYYKNAVHCCRETGNKADFLKTKYITGCCYKAYGLEDFIRFYSRILKYKEFEFAYYQRPATDYLLPCFSRFLDNGDIEMTVTEELGVINETKKIKVIQDTGPNYSPNWNYYNRLPG